MDGEREKAKPQKYLPFYRGLQAPGFTDTTKMVVVQVKQKKPALLHGRLFIYNRAKNLAAFESGLVSSKTCLIVIGGLGDGFLTVDYYESLSRHLKTEQISMVHCILSTSYKAYGFGSVDEDATELQDLIEHMVYQCRKQKIYLMGHSTGCQDIVRWSQMYHQSFDHLPIHGIILQAPVSDREFLQSCISPAEYAATMAYAKNFPKGSTSYMQERPAGTQTKIPITPSRWLSLYGKGGAEDFFSMDLSLSEWEINFSRIIVPMLVLLSKDDEYYPSGFDVRKMGDRFARMNVPSDVKVVYVEGKHSEIWDSDFNRYIVDFINFRPCGMYMKEKGI